MGNLVKYIPDNLIKKFPHKKTGPLKGPVVTTYSYIYTFNYLPFAYWNDPPHQ